MCETKSNQKDIAYYQSSTCTLDK